MPKLRKGINWNELLIFIIICQFTGILGAIFTTPAISSWYIFLNKPFFTPPAWVFGPVWTFLYTLMGISAYRIWKSKATPEQIHSSLGYFFTQLALNLIWSVFFFGFKNPILALLDILILLTILSITIRKFRKIDILSGNLLLPYLTWGIFAAALNLFIIILN